MNPLGGTEAIKHSVAAGMGVAFVSALTIRQELSDGRLAQVPIKGFRLERELRLLQGKDRAESATVKAFLGMLGEGALAQTRSRTAEAFQDMTPEAVDDLVNEAVGAARRKSGRPSA